LIVFGILKKQSRYELPFEADNAPVKLIMKVSHEFRYTMVPPHVWGAFHSIGLDFDTRNEPCRLLFDQEKLRGSVGFQGL
jgi:hypothetical protein